MKNTKAKIDYSTHRLHNTEELRPYLNEMGVDEFWDYAERLYKEVCRLKPGRSFTIDSLVNEERRGLFIKLLCFFIMSRLAVDFCFNSTFTEFKRHKALLEKTPQNKTRNREKNDIQRKR